MAEKVQLALERLLPELRDLERKNIFTKSEISDIVSKRRAFEVALASRNVKPINYLQYIEYESRLEKLRKLRASRIQAVTKKTLSDHSIAAHITQLHRLSTRRFPGSLPLWDAAIAHVLSQSSPLLVTRLLSAAIAMHPGKVSFWLMAARWESEGDAKGMGGGNEEAARRLCMRALRFLKGTKCEKLVWDEWVRLEVAFVERIRGRMAILGIGKGDEVASKAKEDVEMADEEEEEGFGDDAMKVAEEEDDEDAKRVKAEVDRQALSGQEAIVDGAIVRVVLDNALSSQQNSLDAHTHLLPLLRSLPSKLRLPLLEHVYTSLRRHFGPESSSYPKALEILAQRHLFDTEFDSNSVEKGTSAMKAISVEGLSQVVEELDEEPQEEEFKVEGEALVDAVGLATDEWWKAVRGKGKSKAAKGKGKEKAPVALWEAFLSWLERMEDKVEDENLAVFLTTNLTAALSLAPQTPAILLLHLRHLLRTTAPHSTILALAKQATAAFGQAPTSDAAREQLWVARAETAVALSSSAEQARAVLQEAEKALPFSGRLWDVHADWAERGNEEDVGAWYERTVSRVLLADARHPVGFVSELSGGEQEPRDLLPSRYLGYVVQTAPASYPARALKLLNGAPTLRFDLLKHALDLATEQTLPAVNKTELNGLRAELFRRITDHADAGPVEWVAAAKELLMKGDVKESGEVVKRAKRALKGGEAAVFEHQWARVLDA